ncbi:hypothetical protein [Gilliamella sp. WF3-4]|uniref:hypothetical protein n=1 Tax=Gilliamella sp. WF3-4 TaxID=3120255 RepID=UPI00080E481F|nr:hypothetical protein [Gilliamella apicola]OCG17303.1 hypothetical protein A9G47_09320 [Gilliamella apicola]
MKKNCLTLILFFMFSIGYVHSNESPDIWDFYKVSKNSVSGGGSDSERESLIERYSKIKLILIDGEVIVDTICFIAYETTTDIASPLSYWKTTEKVEEYKKIFSEEKIPLGYQFEAIKFPNNDKDDLCLKEGLTDLIRIDNYFVFLTKSGYLITFSKRIEKNNGSPVTYRGFNYKIPNREFSWFGHPMLTNKKIVDDMNKKCDFPDDGSYYNSYFYNECDLHELASYFSKVSETLFDKKKVIYQKGEYQYNLTKKPHKEFGFEMYLNIEKDNKLIDRLSIYSWRILDSAAFIQYYYIDEDFKNIWLLNYVGSEETHDIEKWRHYKIDNSGHFKLLESISCENRDKQGIVKCHND